MVYAVITPGESSLMVQNRFSRAMISIGAGREGILTSDEDSVKFVLMKLAIDDAMAELL